ncbi:MAG: TetR/AcrR family transcriptional regulator [Acidimicrobiales bacterium]
MSRWKPDAVGRLMGAALALFDEQGYDETTVADIAARAGLTRRTFFRYFPDKREVLFSGLDHLEQVFVEAVRQAPDGASPMQAVGAGLAAAADVFTGVHPYARVRARVIAANPELQERELIKLERLASKVSEALEGRQATPTLALLTADLGVRVFHRAFAEWVANDDPDALGPTTARMLDELGALWNT